VISINKILIITGLNSYSIIKKVIQPIKEYEIEVFKAPISISAFLTEKMVEDIINKISLRQYKLILLPGFVQWDTYSLEKKYSINLRKGPEFASDLPMIFKNLKTIELSTKIPANKLFKIAGEKEYEEIVKEQMDKSKDNISNHTFYINEKTSNIIIGRGLPPPIIAEIVNCTEKSDKSILKKVQHYIDSGAEVIDIGCIANKIYPDRVKEIIKLIRSNFDVLISIDSMEKNEIKAAVNEGIDLILSFDLGNYEELEDIPKDIPIVILPTNIKESYFPKKPEIRVRNLFDLTKKLREIGFEKLIADPLLETPISPGICNSLETYFLYNKEINKEENKHLELPLFFGISNVVELMDIDSVGVNGLLASIAVELDIGVVFTVEHSVKLMGGVKELKESIKLNYLSKFKKTPPINMGIQVFRAKGKINQEIPKFNQNDCLLVDKLDPNYIPDEKGYFKIYIDHYSKQIYLLFYSNDNHLISILSGNNAEALSKKIIQLNLTNNIYHLNYLGRELIKAETCLLIGKPYIQDE